MLLFVAYSQSRCCACMDSCNGYYGYPVPYLGVHFGDMLFGELGQLDQLRHDVLFVVAVGTVDEGGGHSVQDGLVLGLLTQGKTMMIICVASM